LSVKTFFQPHDAKRLTHTRNRNISSALFVQRAIPPFVSDGNHSLQKNRGHVFEQDEIIERTDSRHRTLSPLASFYALFICTLFGANAVAIKITLTGLGVFTAAGIRFSIAAVAICLWAGVTGQPMRIKQGQVHQLFIIAALFVTQVCLFYLGLSKTYASRGALIVNLVPFFILIISHLFIPEDRITLKKLIGIVMGFAGVAFVFLDKEGIGGEFRTGDVIILAATILWACSGIYTKKIIDDYEPFQLVIYPMLLSIPVFFIAAVLFDATLIGRFSPEVILALLYQGLITGSFGFVAWNLLLQRYGAVSLHTFIFIMPVVGVCLSTLILGEPITGNILIALGLIAAGIFITQVSLKRTGMI